jgi:biotin synthase
MLHPLVEQAGALLLNNGLIDYELASSLAALPDENLGELLLLADKVRRLHFGNGVTFCAIVNAKSGRCGEDCTFCAQSSHYDTEVRERNLPGKAQLIDAALDTLRIGCDNVGLVTSGRALSDSEFQLFCEAVAELKATHGIAPCVSIGLLDDERARRLVTAGVERVNHNLETSRSHFPNLCTTHEYKDRVNTVRNARAAGLAVCAGGILGTGETVEDWVDLAFTLRELDVDMVPLNFLNPIPGTPLEGHRTLAPLDCLRAIALFRLILPETPIKIAGGREHCLRDLQSWMFFAGATSAMAGNYLTTSGRDAAADAQMIRDLRLCSRALLEAFPEIWLHE